MPRFVMTRGRSSQKEQEMRKASRNEGKPRYAEKWNCRAHEQE